MPISMTGVSEFRISATAINLCLALLIILPILLTVASPACAASSLFISRGDTLLNETDGFVTGRNLSQVGSEPLRLSCSGIPFAATDIVVIDQDNHSCTPYDDQRGKLQPALEDLVLNEDGRQTSASLQKILDNGMLAYFDASAGTIICTPPHQGLTCIQAVDTTAPELQLPAPISVTTHDPSGVQANYTVTASDNVDPNPLVTCIPESGSIFPVGTTLVNCSAKDAGGMTATGTFSVQVNLVYSLTVHITGSGTVVGTSPPYPAIACPGVCSADYPYGASIELTARAAWYSQFSSWIGCISNSNVCQVTMDAERPVSAYFSMISQPVIVYDDRGYESLDLARSSLARNSSIMAKSTYNSTLFEELLFNQNYIVYLNGGYSDLWTASGDLTTVKGCLKVSNGRVNVNSIRLRP
jgi:hypothetical protein